MKNTFLLFYGFMIGITFTVGPWPNIYATRLGDYFVHYFMVTLGSCLWPLVWLAHCIIKILDYPV